MAEARPRRWRVALVSTAVGAAAIGTLLLFRSGDAPGGAGGEGTREEAAPGRGPSLSGLAPEQREAHRQRALKRWQETFEIEDPVVRLAALERWADLGLEPPDAAARLVPMLERESRGR